MKVDSHNPKVLRGIIHNLLEFVYWQEREGNIDGCCDPDNTIEFCKSIGFEYPPKDNDFAYEA